MMEDRVKNIIYRLYGLAESNYWTHYKEFINKEEVVAYGEQDDPEWYCDAWTMLKSDYDMIEDVKAALEDYYKDTATFVLPLESKNEEALQRLRENGGDTLTLEWPSPDNTDESKFSMTEYMLREAAKAQYHDYMSFGEFIDKKKADIWDNCRYSGNWISWYKSLDDKVIIRVSDKKPKYVKGKFDWTGFKEGEDYEDICLDRNGVLFTDPFEATYVSVADSFWDVGQTFSND